jgi:hypothetical protein
MNLRPNIGPAEACTLAETLEPSVNHVQARHSPIISETSDAYPHVVVMLDPKTRVIAADIQWIIQERRRNGRHAWHNRYFCRSKAGLLHCMTCGDMMNMPAPPELLALPDWCPA